MFAVHTISIPTEIKEAILTADTFSWLNRETVAVATVKAVWLGWKRDSRGESRTAKTSPV